MYRKITMNTETETFITQKTITLEDIKIKTTTMLDEFQALRTQFQTEAQAQLKEIVQLIFEASPDLGAIIWTQYSPFFNDGDECIFSVHEVTITNATDEEDLGEVRWGEYGGDNKDIWAAEMYYSVGKWTMEQKAERRVALDLIDFFDGFIQNSDMSDVMEDMFGNHVQVTATREGFQVNEYSHD